MSALCRAIKHLSGGLLQLLTSFLSPESDPAPAAVAVEIFIDIMGKRFVPRDAAGYAVFKNITFVLISSDTYSFH